MSKRQNGVRALIKEGFYQQSEGVFSVSTQTPLGTLYLCDGSRDERNRRCLWSAHEILKEARSEADEMVGAAREAAEEIRKRAYSDGFQDGSKNAVTRSLDNLKLRKRLITALAGELQQAVLLIVSQIVGTSESTPPEIFSLRLKEALLLLRQEPEVVVFVAPAEQESAKQAILELEQEAGLAGQIEIREDSSLQAGAATLATNGCVIHSSREAHVHQLLEHFGKSPQAAYELEREISRELENLMNRNPERPNENYDETPFDF